MQSSQAAPRSSRYYFCPKGAVFPPAAARGCISRETCSYRQAVFLLLTEEADLYIPWPVRSSLAHAHINATAE